MFWMKARGLPDRIRRPLCSSWSFPLWHSCAGSVRFCLHFADLCPMKLHPCQSVSSLIHHYTANVNIFNSFYLRHMIQWLLELTTFWLTISHLVLKARLHTSYTKANAMQSLGNTSEGVLGRIYTLLGPVRQEWSIVGRWRVHFMHSIFAVICWFHWPSWHWLMPMLPATESQCRCKRGAAFSLTSTSSKM